MKQIILLGPKGQSFPVPLTEEIELLPQYRKQLDAIKKEQGWNRLIVIAVEEDQPKIDNLLDELGLKISGREWTPSGGGGEAATVVTSVLSPGYFRAVAKIGFHYFLTQMPGFIGSEDSFLEVRRFIMEGGKIEDFVSWESRPLLIGRSKAHGHMVVGEVDYLRMRAKMQFFVGPDYQSQTFTVVLGPNPARVVAPTTSHGHFYVYFEEAAGAFDGVAVKMPSVSNKLLP